MEEPGSVRIFVVRHAEHVTPAVAHLSRKGSLQATAIATTLKRKRAVSTVYSSPRSYETAQNICKELGLKVVLDKRLLPYNSGKLVGLSMQQVRNEMPEVYRQRFVERNPDFKVPDGESLNDRFARVKSFLADAVRLHRGEQIVVVTHGGIIDDLFRNARSLTPSQLTGLKKPYGSMSVLVYARGRFHEEVWGGVDHLPEVVAESPTGGQLYLFPHQVAGSFPMLRGDLGELCKPATREEVDTYAVFDKECPEVARFAPHCTGQVVIDVKHIMENATSLSRPLELMHEPHDDAHADAAAGSQEQQENAAAAAAGDASDAMNGGLVVGDDGTDSVAFGSAGKGRARSFAGQVEPPGHEADGEQDDDDDGAGDQEDDDDGDDAVMCDAGDAGTRRRNRSDWSARSADARGDGPKRQRMQSGDMTPSSHGAPSTSAAAKSASEETEHSLTDAASVGSQPHANGHAADADRAASSLSELQLAAPEGARVSASAAATAGEGRAQRTKGSRLRRAWSVVTLWDRFIAHRKKKVLEAEPGKFVYIVMDNLTHGLARPHILDLKMGTQQHGSFESAAKKLAKQERVASTTSAALGARIAGMQLYDEAQRAYVLKDKYWGRALGEPGLVCALRAFVTEQRTGLVRADVVKDVIAQLDMLEQAVRGTFWRFYGCSVLIVYDGGSSSSAGRRDRLTSSASDAGAHDVTASGLRSLRARSQSVDLSRVPMRREPLQLHAHAHSQQQQEQEHEQPEQTQPSSRLRERRATMPQPRVTRRHSALQLPAHPEHAQTPPLVPRGDHEHETRELAPLAAPKQQFAGLALRGSKRSFCVAVRLIDFAKCERHKSGSTFDEGMVFGIVNLRKMFARILLETPPTETRALQDLLPL